MTTHHHYRQLLFSLLIFSMATRKCLTYMEHCRPEHVDDVAVWNCSDLGLPELHFMDVVPQETAILDLHGNWIKTVTRFNLTCSALSKCTNCLKFLYLQNNKISKIVDDAFQGLHCLKELDLSFNYLNGSSIDAKTFQGLHRLQTLSMRGNPLIVVPDFAFLTTELLMLQNLDLASCHLSKIHNVALDHLWQLQHLDLSNNSLDEMPATVLRGLNDLQVLNLSRNLLGQIVNFTFEDLGALETLDLSFNHLEMLSPKAFGRLGDLLTLNLRNNKFKKWPFTALRPLQRLKYIDLSENPLDSMIASDDPHTDRIPVTSLVLQKTSLTRVNSSGFNAFPNLEILHLSQNPDLHYIDPTAFSDNYRNIREVYLHDNGLVSLPESLLPWTQLTVIDLERNPWRCDCKVKWIVQTGVFNASKTFRCQSPAKYSGRNLLELSPSSLTCRRSLFLISFIVMLTIASIALLVVIFVTWRYRYKIRCMRKTKGKYISVYMKDVDIDGGSATIAMSEEEVKLTQAENDDL